MKESESVPKREPVASKFVLIILVVISLFVGGVGGAYLENQYEWKTHNSLRQKVSDLENTTYKLRQQLQAEEFAEENANASGLSIYRTKASNTRSTQKNSITVYGTNSGSKYHRAGCRYLNKSAIPMPLERAVARYEPCSVCNPPRP